MRYWTYFAAKLTVSGALLYGLLSALNFWWPPEPHFLGFGPPRFGYNLPYTLAVGAWFLLGSGALYLCILDQRYRCRVCLRRLRMPIGIGSWSSMLQRGRPRIEYICTYGHGKLNVPECQISGLENPQWTAHEDMWEELCASAKGRDYGK